MIERVCFYIFQCGSDFVISRIILFMRHYFKKFQGSTLSCELRKQINQDFRSQGNYSVKYRDFLSENVGQRFIFSFIYCLKLQNGGVMQHHLLSCLTKPWNLVSKVDWNVKREKFPYQPKQK